MPVSIKRHLQTNVTIVTLIVNLETIGAHMDLKGIQLLHVVIRHYGNATELAKALDVEHPAISQWLKKGRIPELRCYQIEIVSHGKFKAADLLMPGYPRNNSSIKKMTDSPTLYS